LGIFVFESEYGGISRETLERSHDDYMVAFWEGESKTRLKEGALVE
jgi:hypothetical protein